MVSIIESQGDLVLAHKLKNNFKLISIKDNEKNKPCELELENFKNEKIKSSQLWELSKMLESATKKRWIVSLSCLNLTLPRYHLLMSKYLQRFTTIWNVVTIAL